MRKLRHLHLARAEVDLLVDLVVDPVVDLLVGVVSTPTRLFPRCAADCGDSILQRSLRHIEVGT